MSSTIIAVFIFEFANWALSVTLHVRTYFRGPSSSFFHFFFRFCSLLCAWCRPQNTSTPVLLYICVYSLLSWKFFWQQEALLMQKTSAEVTVNRWITYCCFNRHLDICPFGCILRLYLISIPGLMAERFLFIVYTWTRNFVSTCVIISAPKLHFIWSLIVVTFS